MSRVDVVMKALEVEREDAEKNCKPFNETRLFRVD